MWGFLAQAATADGDAVKTGVGEITIRIATQGVETISVNGQPVAVGDAAPAVTGATGAVAGDATSTIVNGAADAGHRVLHALLEIWHGVLDHLPMVVIGIIVILITGLAARWTFTLIRKVIGQTRIRASLRDLFAQLAYIAIWITGILAAAMVVFPGFSFSQILATAGLASIALGFAFKDIFENFFAGILILWRFPFEIGDFIEIEGVEGVEGKVEDIWIRMTLIRRVTGELVCVPNATIFNNPVNILTNHRHRRQAIIAGVAYGEDVDESREVIRKAVEACQTVDTELHPVQVFAQEFASSSINFEVAWWTGSTPVRMRESRDEVIGAIKRAMDNAGIEIPYPYRTLVFSKNEPDIIKAVSGREEK